MSEPEHPTRVHVTYQGAGDPHTAREAVFAAAYEAMTGRPAAEFSDSPARPQLVRLTFQVDGCTCTHAHGSREPHPITDRCPPCLVEEYTDGAWRPVG